MGRTIWACGILLASHVLANAGAEVAAGMTPPRIVHTGVDWDAARQEMARTPALLEIPSAHDDGENDIAVARINAVANREFAGIGASAVPVLVPFDADAALRAPADAVNAGVGGGFHATFFYGGPTGYDAAFTVPSELMSGVSGRARKEDARIYISGFSIIYELSKSVVPRSGPAKEHEPDFPGIQRSWHESYVRYSFRRYGAYYTVSMLCTDGPPRGRWMACRDADRIVARFLASLKLAGGAPQPQRTDPVEIIDRPSVVSPDFTFAPPGQLLPNTGFRKADGHADDTVYAKIRFPLAQAPAFANSQSFMHWGNCDFTGRTSKSTRKGAPYRCTVNDKPLIFDESAAENRTYPWRDNFCEHRYFFVGQCPGGQGHQGVDLRPATCKLRNAGADRCNPYQDNVVAVRDGTIMRDAGRESLFLVVNAPGERVRFRYLHMNPNQLDAHGLVNGRKVLEGANIGKVGNFDKIENGTTYHLHFDMQVPTTHGWVFVNPYMTLVASYERLIGGRGREFVEETVAAHPAQIDSPATVSMTPVPERSQERPAVRQRTKKPRSSAKPPKNRPAARAIGSRAATGNRFATDAVRENTFDPHSSPQ